MKVADFDFALPPELIAQQPIRPRDAARLLAIGATESSQAVTPAKAGVQKEPALHVPWMPASAGMTIRNKGDESTRSEPIWEDRQIAELPLLLRAGDLLVYNDTRVIKARLIGRRGAARVEVTLHQPVDAGTWRAFARGARRLKPGDRVDFAADFAATVVGKGEGGEVTLAFPVQGAALLAALERHGQMPLPPYIKRPPGGARDDERDYQTIWAEKAGAVAASTAGLHFTPELLAALERAGIARVAVTLHVGAGTFLPVKVADSADHRMHAEWGELPAASADAINAARAGGRRIVAVGTTALRVLETVADAAGRVRAWSGSTQLFIVPGFKFRVVEMLLTNFHLPRSTLFMLVSAFAGLERMKAAYAHAIATRYRFFSYGDACLIARADGT